MDRSTRFAAALFVFAVLVGGGSAEILENTPAAPVARGSYLVNQVAQCVQCHSPHEPNGDLIRGRRFEGNAMPFTTPFAQGDLWATRAPVLKRLPGWSQEDFVHLLMTGRRLNSSKPSSPMPQFRFARQDARAIYAYLKSL